MTDESIEFFINKHQRTKARHKNKTIYPLSRFTTKEDMDRYERIEEDFIKNNHISRIHHIHKGIDVKTLLATNRAYYGNHHGENLHIDHAKYFKIKNGPYFLLYCPYAPYEELIKDMEWAERHNLYYKVYGPDSSIYGCNSSMVIISKTPIVVIL